MHADSVHYYSPWTEEATSGKHISISKLIDSSHLTNLKNGFSDGH